MLGLRARGASLQSDGRLHVLKMNRNNIRMSDRRLFGGCLACLVFGESRNRRRGPHDGALGVSGIARGLSGCVGDANTPKGRC